MVEINPLAWWRRFLALPNESRTKTLIIALLVALVSAGAVSVTAILLKPLQAANLEAEREARIEAMIATLPGLAGILRASGADSLETRLVDLETGRFATSFDPANFDQRAAASDPDLSDLLPREADIAGIGRRPHHAPVHLLLRNAEIALLVLPLSGAGYGSTIYAYLALEQDLRTIAAFTIIEHNETPGIGARIEDEAWQALWPGKEIIDDTGEVRIALVRTAADGPYEVDGISGATRTSVGITNMLRFWLGNDGFGPLLANIRSGEISP